MLSLLENEYGILNDREKMIVNQALAITLTKINNISKNTHKWPEKTAFNSCKETIKSLKI